MLGDNIIAHHPPCIAHIKRAGPAAIVLELVLADAPRRPCRANILGPYSDRWPRTSKALREAQVLVVHALARCVVPRDSRSSCRTDSPTDRASSLVRLAVGDRAAWFPVACRQLWRSACRFRSSLRRSSLAWQTELRLVGFLVRHMRKQFACSRWSPSPGVPSGSS